MRLKVYSSANGCSYEDYLDVNLDNDSIEDIEDDARNYAAMVTAFSFSSVVELDNGEEIDLEDFIANRDAGKEEDKWSRKHKYRNNCAACGVSRLEFCPYCKEQGYGRPPLTDEEEALLTAMNLKPKLEWIESKIGSFNATPKVGKFTFHLNADAFLFKNTVSWYCCDEIKTIEGTAPTLLDAQLAAEKTLGELVDEMITKLTEIRGRLG